MTNDPIETLKALDTRWPGLFDVWRSMNGHGDLKNGYQKIMEMQTRMLEDPEFSQGVEAVAKAVAQMLERADPDHAKWLEENGFIDQRLMEMKAQIMQFESVLNSVDSSREEVEAAVLGLREIHAATQKFAVAKEAGLVRAAAIIKETN